MELAYKKQNVFLYKFMPCLLFFMFAVLCLFGSYSNASDVEVTYNNVDYTILPNDSLLESYSYLTIYTTNSYILCIYSNYPIVAGAYPPVEEFSAAMYQDGTIWGFAFDSSWNKTPIKRQVLPISSAVDNVLDFSSAEIKNDDCAFHFYINSVGVPDSTFLYANHDIYDFESNLVFQQPPMVQPIIASQVEGVEMDKTLAEIMGILPVILVVIVGLIAIRKAIQFLMVRMKRA